MRVLPHILGIILLLIVLAPTPPELAPIRIEDILTALVAIVVFGNPSKHLKNVSRAEKNVVFWLLLLCFAGLLGTTAGVIFLSVSPEFVDFLFIPQIAKYSLVGAIFWATIRDPPSLNILYWYGVAGLLCEGLVCVSQYWNLFNVNGWLTPHYFQREIALQQMVDARMNFRTKGTFGNPNYAGFCLTWLLALTLPRLLGSGLKLISFPLAAGAVAVGAFGLITLQSRTSLLGLSAILLLVTYLRPAKAVIFAGVSLFAFVVIGSSITTDTSVGSLLEERDFGDRLRLDSVSTQRSVRGRTRDLVNPLKELMIEPWRVLGRGTAKMEFRNDSHNGYTWILQRFGLLGLIAYLGIFLGVFMQALPIRVWSSSPAVKRTLINGPLGIVIGFVLTFLIWGLGDLTGNVFKDPRLFSLCMISVGVILGTSKALANGLRGR